MTTTATHLRAAIDEKETDTTGTIETPLQAATNETETDPRAAPETNTTAMLVMKRTMHRVESLHQDMTRTRKVTAAPPSPHHPLVTTPPTERTKKR